MASNPSWSVAEWLRIQLHLDAESAIDLGETEEILHVTGRHYIVLIGRLIPPLFSLIFFGGLALYRALGGQFLASQVDDRGSIDAFNWLLLILMLLLGFIWIILAVRGKQNRSAQLIITMALIGHGLLFYFRFTGGRIFHLDANTAVGQSGDALNLILVLGAIISTVMVLFTFYDWLNDELILTNQRIVYDNDQVIIPRLIERRVQRQIFLEDVQDVNAATKTYPQHWLQYGTIEIKSARINGNIMFTSADKPMVMQNQIMAQVRALRKASSEHTFEELIADRIYGEKASSASPLAQPPKQTRMMGWMRQFLPDNPEINYQTQQLVWRPHWLFLVRGLIGPVLWLLLGVPVVLVGGSALLLGFPLIIFGLLVVMLVFVAWAAYEVEDYRNDTYTLTPEKVIDIEKKPFGPEERREAGLGSINNVQSKTTYISNLLGYGDVELSTAGAGGNFTFHRVPRPADVVTKVTEYNVRFKRKDKDRALNDTLALLRHYHEAQIKHDEIKS
ncbi:hypothetical protein [Candidatus Chloroploca asiatica]|uniref:DUF304 domain-containing protein n=1 Tax=Candidatus Chloroploca asiatica TaxID=1506545 RepID=A0A2H3KH42_9CHLR|nr:hypothetical protein [Candidatus Chloroploca asiatica]PDV97085.1 hypothetical protein A9Q02_19390 [Candidatus Chloroploca asiatica]